LLGRLLFFLLFLTISNSISFQIQLLFFSLSIAIHSHGVSLLNIRINVGSPKYWRWLAYRVAASFGSLFIVACNLFFQNIV
jgi:hypothetical protein